MPENGNGRSQERGNFFPRNASRGKNPRGTNQEKEVEFPLRKPTKRTRNFRTPRRKLQENSASRPSGKTRKLPRVWGDREGGRSRRYYLLFLAGSPRRRRGFCSAPARRQLRVLVPPPRAVDRGTYGGIPARERRRFGIEHTRSM
jgi:hypothetical protein